jgi:cell wall-associated NlpC family hydrolase
MKKMLAIASMTMTLALTTCGISANAEISTEVEETQITTEYDYKSFIRLILQMKETQTLLEEQQAEFIQVQLRAQKMQTRIEALMPYVDKTWYVFSGITPDGWDCSGLVMWYYSEFGIELEHSVTAQIHSGQIVDQPKPGDIVAFKHNGAEMGYHNGIYVGNDMYIHAPREGRRTTLSSVSEYAKKHSVVVYTRINLGVLE